MKPRYLLDTNICIYIAKQHSPTLLDRFQALSSGEAVMSTITYGELYFGVQRSQYPEKTVAILDELISLISPLPLPIETGSHYGRLRALLTKTGTLIGNNDLWIAAHALSTHLTLVTNNTREFSRVPELPLENWVEHPH